MPPEIPRRPILYRGEEYTLPIVKTLGFGKEKDLPFSYEEARLNILGNIETLKNSIGEIPDKYKLPHEFIVSVRISPGFAAKSYYPSSIFDERITQTDFVEVGSRVWKEAEESAETEDNRLIKRGKLIFARTTEEGLTKLERKLNQSESQLPDKFISDIRKINAIDTLKADEKIQSIPSNWEEGRLEVVIHPFALDRDLVASHFRSLLRELNVNEEFVRIKSYDGGITFASIKATRSVIEGLAKYNPLRVIHPLTFRNFPNMRGSQVDGAPLPPLTTNRSSITIGMFDGGIPDNHPLLSPFCDAIEATLQPEEQSGIDHGTSVAGCLLYGPMNQYRSTDVLPDPLVSVASFRVFPTSDPDDADLYEVIDSIEEIVPRQSNIHVYNLSIGPSGPIFDDLITRFTFACDLLAQKHNVLFCTAVGNDGDLSEDLNRIQSPSDMVNGLGVASCTEIGGITEHAPYSSIGPGREGNKCKPDVAAFGGCERNPIQLISPVAGKKYSANGTSFATPSVANAVGQLIGRSSNAIDALVSRALITHSTANLNGSKHDHKLGYGKIPDEIEKIATCSPNSYTLIYQGTLVPGKFTEFKIPWPDLLITGKVKFSWTIAALTVVDPHSPDDYTSTSLGVTFYPNANKYIFSKEIGGKIKTQRVDTVLEANTVRDLLADGYEKSTFPVSASGPTPFAKEEDLRADMKWDTVDHRTLSKKADDITNPIFHVHAYGRGIRHNGVPVKYALVLTIEAPGTVTNFYNKILEKYPALLPVQISARNAIEVRVNG